MKLSLSTHHIHTDSIGKPEIDIKLDSKSLIVKKERKKIDKKEFEK